MTPSMRVTRALCWFTAGMVFGIYRAYRRWER
jgi:hypothetical protein